VKAVCHIISGLTTGGAERALARLLAHGLQGAFDNHVVCLGPEGQQAAAVRRSGARLHLLNMGSPAHAPAGIARLRRLVRELRPALIQGWMYHGNLAASLASGFARGPVPVCWNIRQSLDEISGDKWLTRQIIRLGALISPGPAAIIYNSEVSAAQHEAFGYASAARHVIPNGFEADNVRPDPVARMDTRRRLGIEDGEFLFAHLARWHPMKHHAGFIEAAAACAMTAPQSRFFMAGTNVKREAAALLEGLPQAVRNRFIVEDEISDPISLLQVADALVVSSRRAEGFPNVLGEAMMTATPCITTDVGSSASVVGSAGVVVPPAEVAALRDAMLALCRDPDRARALGAMGRERLERLFDIKTVVREYEALYRRLISEGRTT
jgi:glycosyltransferase involved in cell wall biosynthesis